MEQTHDIISKGQESYEQWLNKLRADPHYQAIYEEEAAKKELWLQFVEARQAAGLTQADVAKRLGVSQAQVARIEKRGYDAYTLNTLRRYVQALGIGFTLDVSDHYRLSNKVVRDCKPTLALQGNKRVVFTK